MNTLLVRRRLLSDVPAALGIVASLAVGLGTTIAAFTVVDNVLFRSLPARAPERLVRLFAVEKPFAGNRNGLSYPLYREYRQGTGAFEGMVAYSRGVPLHLSSERLGARRVNGELVSANYFEFLEARPAAGRLLSSSDERDASQVVVISYALWQEALGASGDAVGSSIRVNGVSYTLIGVAPKGFEGITLETQPDAWLPTSAAGADPVYRTQINGLSNPYFAVVARLRDGISIAQAQAELDVLAEQNGAGQPVLDPTAGEYNSGWVRPWPQIIGADEAAAPSARRLAHLILAIVSLVLIIACVNAAGLLVARSVSRRRHLAIQLALGAPRSAIVTEVLIEGVVLCGIASIAGLLIATALNRLTALAAPETLPLVLAAGHGSLVPDSRILIFTISAALLTGILFALVPALEASRTNALAALGGTASLTQRSSWTSHVRKIFVVVQIASSVLLLNTAGLLLRTFASASRVDMGVNPAGVLTATLDFARQGYPPAVVAGRLESVLRDLRTVPGVLDAAISNVPPPGAGATSVHVDDKHDQPIGFTMTSPGYFSTVGIPLIKGRDFSDRDLADRKLVGIVDETFVRRYWPNVEPLERRVAGVGPADAEVEVIGVVRAHRTAGVREEPRPLMYVPFLQFHTAFAWQQTTYLAARTSDPSVGARIRQVVGRLEPDLPLFDLRPMTENIYSSLANEIFLGRLLSVLAAIALVLSTSGLYGLILYASSQRTPEFGLRLALGATTTDVIRLVVLEGLSLGAIGLFVGLLGAFLCTRIVESNLFNTRALEPEVLLGVSAILAVAVLIASLVPAVRASRTDPMCALRAE